ncbi:class I SAM-dependent methyltransferase [Candidatus Methanomassiliicoccus intestinalis]|uniref:class I SAM-dependent methyltransferase n=1 Tax=Candidatus Methanomassiliicoccus intestinalis TaxID=1406512 RepID=UPI0037DC5718
MNKITGITDYPDKDLKEMWNQFNDTFDGMRQACILKTALEYRVFEILTKPHSVDELSEITGIKKELVEYFCLALVSMNLINKTGEKFIDSEVAVKYLTSNSEIDQTLRLANQLSRLQLWAELPTILKDGPVKTEEKFDEELWIKSIAQGSLNGQICKLKEKLEKNINLSKCNDFLDIGGGHGLYSIGLFLAYPHVRFTLFDKPEIIKVAKNYAEKYNAPLRFIEGDYYQDMIPGTYDIVFSSFTSCGVDPQLIDKIKSCLHDGGYFIVRKHRNETSEDPFMNLEWNFLETPGFKLGRKRWEFDTSMSTNAYQAMLESKGFKIEYFEKFDSLSELLIAKLNK